MNDTDPNDGSSRDDLPPHLFTKGFLNELRVRSGYPGAPPNTPAASPQVMFDLDPDGGYFCELR